MKTGKYQSPATCTACGAGVAVPGRGTYNIQCDKCGEWVTNRKTPKTKTPAVDMTMTKKELTEIALSLGLTVPEKDTKTQIIAAIEAV